MSGMANLALDGGDPRQGSIVNFTEKGHNPAEYSLDHGGHVALEKSGFSIEAAQIHNDPDVLFEEYLHHAKITRAAEHHYEGNAINRKEPWSLGGIVKNRFSKGKPSYEGEKIIAKDHDDFSTVTDEEWRQASRATRTVTWGTIFFLITTDILGPSGAPWAFANTGFGPGVALYVTFGFLASVSGWYVWGVFMHLDSDRYPLRDFGQAFFRVYGQAVRHVINVLQSIQMFMLVAVLVLSNGSAISQISVGQAQARNGVCYVICLFIFAIIGAVLGQIRTLQRFGWLANFSVWCTVTTCFLSIGIVAQTKGAVNYPIMQNTYGGTTAYGVTQFPCGDVSCPLPTKTFGGSPPYGYASGGVGFLGTYQGINTIIYAYGGAMLFFNLLAEMRNPWDFWKGMLIADLFIFFAYVFFGVFQYAYQGQYTYSTNIQSLPNSKYSYQTAGNILTIAGGLIAAALYGNIGIKVVYNNVFVEIFHFPTLAQRGGKIIWIFMVPLYWGLAFVVGAAVPNLGLISSLVGAFCIGNFTYAFPAFLKIGFEIKKGAMLPEEHFDETTRRYVRVDSGMKRWIRGYKKSFLITTINIFYMLGALVVCGMGCYSAIQQLRNVFAPGASVVTAFKCRSPFYSPPT